MAATVLVVGIGNALRRDDGVGVHVIDALRQRGCGDDRGDIALQDGGTLGLALLPQIKQSETLILVDAAQIGAAPGTVRSYEGSAMDALLAVRHATAHDVAVADLMGLVALSGGGPTRRALVAVQPADTGWGLELSQPVTDAIAPACAAVLSVIDRWTQDG